MNIRLVVGVLGIILIVLVVGYSLTLRGWQKAGLTGSKLRQRQRSVRRFAAVVVFLLLGLATFYWGLSAFGKIGAGPGIDLIPLGAIVCLVGVISVRGLWFLTGFRWLKSVSYRVSLQAGFVAIISAVTAFNLRNVPGPTFLYLLIFAFLAAMVALGSYFLELLVPDSENMLELVGDVGESQTTVEEKTQKAVEALKDVSHLLAELEHSIIERSESVNALRQKSEKYSEMVKVGEEAANALLQELVSKLDLRTRRERAISLGSGLLFLVIALLWDPYIKRLFGIG